MTYAIQPAEEVRPSCLVSGLDRQNMVIGHDGIIESPI